MSKGSAPRPYSVSQETFANNYDAIFRKKVAKSECGCYNCMSKVNNENGISPTSYTFIVCPDCGNKRCPKATDHNLACTSSNEPGQLGSRY
jgi:hypothetical protein